MVTKELHEKYRKAEPLTDEEVILLFMYYNGLKGGFFGYTPPEYRLIEQDVNKQYERLREMRIARNADKVRKLPVVHC